MWITVALLTPFWWGLGLFVLALLGDLLPGWGEHVSRLFDRLGSRQEPLEAAAS
jgi:hypothetical protein